jgi:hypothetical protein
MLHLKIVIVLMAHGLSKQVCLTGCDSFTFLYAGYRTPEGLQPSVAISSCAVDYDEAIPTTSSSGATGAAYSVTSINNATTPSTSDGGASRSTVVDYATDSLLAEFVIELPVIPTDANDQSVVEYLISLSVEKTVSPLATV